MVPPPPVVPPPSATGHLNIGLHGLCGGCTSAVQAKNGTSRITQPVLLSTITLGMSQMSVESLRPFRDVCGGTSEDVCGTSFDVI